MKKPILVLILIFAIAIFAMDKIDEQKLERDHEKIEQVKEACQKIADSNLIFSMGDSAITWYTYPLEDMEDSHDDVYIKLREYLGEDFEPILTSKEELYVSFFPYDRSFRIYVGEAVEDNMVYPDWNYKALSSSND